MLISYSDYVGLYRTWQNFATKYRVFHETVDLHVLIILPDHKGVKSGGRKGTLKRKLYLQLFLVDPGLLSTSIQL